MEKEVRKIVSIAGSDSCGGAGIQVDVKTSTSLGCHCCTVLTVVTAQNTVEIKSIVELDETIITKQLDCVFDDIEIDVVKLGVLYSKKITVLVCKYIKGVNEKRRREKKNELSVVFDPVFVASSGALLVENKEYIKFCLHTLCPICTIITPNFYECKSILDALQCDANFDTMNSADLCKLIVDQLDIQACYIKSCNLGKKAVIVKENEQFAVDHLCIRRIKNKERNKERSNENNTDKNNDKNADNIGSSKDEYMYEIYKLKTERTVDADIHGTGCTLSTAIACFLAKEKDLVEACIQSKTYIYQCIKNAYELGQRSKGLHNLKAACELTNTKVEVVDVVKVLYDM